MSFAAIALGQDPNDPSDLDAVRDKLLALKAQIRAFWSSEDEWNKHLAGGQFDVATYWSGSASRSKTAFGLPVEFVIPNPRPRTWAVLGLTGPAYLWLTVAVFLPLSAMLYFSFLTVAPFGGREVTATLGANPWQTLRRVTLPVLAPGVVAAALFAFAVSFDQFMISYFLAPPGVSTLPVEIYSAIRKGFTPEVNAVSSIIIAISMGVVLLSARLYRFGGVSADGGRQ